MKICESVREMRAARERMAHGCRVGLVPTMGALHEGHLSLVRAAKRVCDSVVVSIFVNPLQFGPNEDLAKYPRTFARDCEFLEGEQVEVVFAPSVEDMYPKNNITYVSVEGMSEKLCGRSRPGHFRGVTTVVAKLFHIVEPGVAFFGQKDAAQCAIIRRMVRDLNVPVEIAVGPIVREPDGLAMSSRNAYLGPQERKSALALSRALGEMKACFERGERSSSKLLEAGKLLLSQEAGARLEYLEIVDPDSLEPVGAVEKTALAALAAFVGNTRLIDNVLLSPERHSSDLQSKVLKR
ncbi:MAG: pantoate--beta-alanine ligase [Terriglobales bacterium]